MCHASTLDSDDSNTKDAYSRGCVQLCLMLFSHPLRSTALHSLPKSNVRIYTTIGHGWFSERIFVPRTFFLIVSIIILLPPPPPPPPRSKSNGSSFATARPESHLSHEERSAVVVSFGSHVLMLCVRQGHTVSHWTGISKLRIKVATVTMGEFYAFYRLDRIH